MRVFINLVAAILISLSIHTVVAAQTVTSSLPGTFPGSGGLTRPMTAGDLPPAYPAWPERMVRTNMVPPPPDGPYMSSAMSDIDAFPSNTGGLRNDIDEQSIESSLFSVDTPWPETPERDRPELWVPESGEYRFVPEELVRQLESPVTRRGLQPQMYQPYPRYPPPPPVRPPYFGYY